jgi:murein DD-endopeptidase MepM/ murein hydrolase activator NlpD
MSRNIVTIERRRKYASAALPLSRARIVLVAIALVGCFQLSAESIYHILQKGETLFSLSREYNVSVDAIVAANQIRDPSRLKIGQRLLIPSLHRVLKGETLFSIARLYGSSVEALRSANKLGPKSVLRAGDLLVIPIERPGAGAPTVADAPATPKAARTSSTGAGPTPAASSAVSTAIPSAAPTADPVTGAPAAFDPPAVKISSRVVDMKLSWPCGGEANYLDGKLFGIMFRPRRGDPEKAIASGTVVSAGPYRGFGQVVFVQGRGGFIYVYGGNESIEVRVGDKVLSGQELGRVGVDAKEGRPTPVGYFFVFRNGEALDPAVAPRN